MKTQSNDMTKTFESNDFEDLTAEELVLASGGCRRGRSRRGGYGGGGAGQGPQEEMMMSEGLAGRSELPPEAFSSTRPQSSFDGITVRIRISSPSGITRT